MFNKSFLATLIISAGVALQPVSSLAADVTINLGYTGAKGGSYTILADKFEELAEKYTHGSVDVKVRCCGQLVTEDEAFKALQLGTIDMSIITNSNISPHYPLMDVFVLPYIFQSGKHASQVLDGSVGQKFALDFQAKTKVHLLTYGGLEYRDFYNSVRPINTVKDMQGLKIRTPKNEVMLETFEAFGASPIPIAWADTPTALQTGTVVGSDNGTSFIKSQKFYEIADNLAILEHFAYFSPLLASSRVMKKLNDEQISAIQKAASEAGIFHRAALAGQSDEIRQNLADKGMKVTRPDRSSFIAVALTVQDDFAAQKNAAFGKLLMDIRSEAN
ncbi:MAG: TRAP transporter substrate-binding protein [Pseudomonadales bacterium]